MFLLRLVMTAALAAMSIEIHAGVSVVGSLSQERSVQAGETYRGVIAIRNSGSEPAEVKVYQTDYAFSADGRNEYGAPGRLPRSNAKWLHLGQEQLTIAPGTVANALYEVQVPSDPALKGTYWSMVVVEPVSARVRRSLPWQ